MKFKAEIRDITRDITRVYTGEWNEDLDKDLTGLEFIWSEGNYSCDCNRSIFFSRAGGIKDPFDLPADHPDYSDCNTGPNRFKVKVTTEDGKVIHEG